MSFIDYFRTAFDLAKKAQSVELQGELLAMREDYNTLQEKNIALQARVKELEAAQALAGSLVYRAPAYYVKNDSDEEGPYCQRCWDVDRRLVRVSIVQAMVGETVVCGECNMERSRRRT